MPGRVDRPGRSEKSECPFLLSEREIQTLELAASGLTYRSIARALAIALPTVRDHLASARNKLGAANTTHAVALAFVSGLIDLRERHGTIA